MRALLAAALLALAPAAAHAKGKKTATYKEFVKLVMQSGEPAGLAARTGVPLGFPDKQLPTRMLYRGNLPDGFERAFIVIVDKQDKDAKPQAVVLTASKQVTLSSGAIVDGYAFAADLTGKLDAASHGSGAPSSVRHDKLPLDREASARFKRELDFWLKESAGRYLK